MSQVHAITSQQELREIAARNKVIILLFHASWSAPCKLMASDLPKKCQENGITLVTADGDEALDLSGKFKIRSLPHTFVLDKDCVVVGQFIGATVCSNIVNMAVEYMTK